MTSAVDFELRLEVGDHSKEIHDGGHHSVKVEIDVV